MGFSCAVVGAGFSGLCIAAKLKSNGFDNLSVFEEREDVGGVWMANKYPGCASDIPTALYSFSFCPNPNWNELFSPQEDIQKYATDVAKKFDFYRHTQFKVRVTKLVWLQLDTTWELTSENLDTSEISVHYFDMVFMSVGTLRLPNIPEPFRKFKGPLMHSAEWKSDVDIRSKKVGIVGSGTSAIQIIAAIAKDVEHLTVFQRRPAHVLPRPQFRIPRCLQILFRLIPGMQWLLRICVFWIVEISFLAYIKDSFMNTVLSKVGEMHLRHSIANDDDLKKRLEPKYSLGCKRLGLHSDYYNSMKLSNVKLVTSSIQEVREHSIVTEDEEETHIDVLILATGFRVHEYYAPLNITGIDGVKPTENWTKEGPSSYLGIVTSSLPNLFFIGGPNTMPGHTSVLFTMECQANWCIKVIQEMLRMDFKMIRVKETAEKDHMNQLQEKMKGTVWAEDCGNWFTDKRGVVTAINPVSSIHYWSQTRNPVFDVLGFQ